MRVAGMPSIDWPSYGSEFARDHHSDDADQGKSAVTSARCTMVSTSSARMKP